MRNDSRHIPTWVMWLVIWSSAAFGQSPEQQPEQWVSGTVIEQKKYSITVAGAGTEWNLKIPENTPIWLQLDRPQFDWSQRTLRLEILASSPDGDPQHNLFREYPLPDVCWIDVEFAHENERQRVMSGDVKRLVRYRLRGADEPETTDSRFDPLRFSARIESIDEHGLARVIAPGEVFVAELGSREAFLTGMSTVDLLPFATTLRARVIEWDGQWMAQEIQFRPVADSGAAEKLGLPRVLMLGDEVSLSYFPALVAELRGSCNVTRPPENCRGSANWPRLAEWLGPYHLPGRGWDVIGFNVGLADLGLPIEEYSKNLEQWIAALEQTGAKLVWINTAPVPPNYVQRGNAPVEFDDIVRLNEAAKKVVDQHPSIVSVDLFEWVQARRDNELRPWWRGRAAAFGPNHAPAIIPPIVAALRD